MSRLFMEVDGMRQIVRRLRALAQSMEYLYQESQRHLQALEQVWQGPAPAEYIQKQQDLLRRAHRYYVYLLELAALLEREIHQYLSISQRLG